MNKNIERKNIIFEIVQNNKNVKVIDLIFILSDKYEIKVDKRTIIRDLNKLIDENLVLKEWNTRNTYYTVSVINKIFKEINIEKYFEIDYQKREVQENFNFDIFKLLETDIFTNKEKIKLENLQNEFIKNISQYDSQTLINKEYERIMIEFSWKSSAIEWNTYSLLNTEALIKENIKDETKSPEETQMILNHKDAFNESIQNREKFLKLKSSNIEYLHSVLIKKLNVQKNIRKSGVWITWTKYKPLNNEFQIKESLDELVNLINKKESFFEKAFLVLILLSYIQAFEDWNKRTARMFSNAILLANNSIPLSYRIVDIVEYKKASILFYELNNLSYFKKIFIEQFEDAVSNYFK